MEWGLIIPLIIVGIEFCLSIACVVMGGVHLNECQNQAAIFLLVNGGLTLLIIAIVGISYFFADKDKFEWVCSSVWYIMGSIPLAGLVKLGLSIYGSVAIFGKFETQIITIQNTAMFVSGSSLDTCHDATFTFAFAIVIINWVTFVGSIICICVSW